MTESFGAYPAEQTMAPIDTAPSAPFHPPAVRSSGHLLRPPPLLVGDTIGVVAPSYAPQPGWLLRGAKAMEEAGYKVILDSEIERFRRFQKREDERRAENLMAIWRNPEVKVVISGTGGYGAMRLLPYLDPEVFRKNPKAFVGYSDITALHLWLMRRAQLRVFHGPTLDDLFPGGSDPSAQSLLTALTTPRPETLLGRGSARSVRPGSAVGRLTGGNLSLVQQTVGTPYEIDTRDAILFLEETRDPMSVVDERLLHLRAAGLLRHVRGIVFGQLSVDRSEEDEFEDFLLDLVSDLEVPILMDFPAGHEVPNLTLPLGTEVEIVADETTGWLSYREDALALPEDRPRLSLV
ncbi:MAG TPA: LD-carboxypeptidase [Gemmatimonadaceae bacterium]|nr:LD-carboxypeptidase [Gemmatimonadaceae bacterium]